MGWHSAINCKAYLFRKGKPLISLFIHPVPTHWKETTYCIRSPVLLVLREGSRNIQSALCVLRVSVVCVYVITSPGTAKPGTMDRSMSRSMSMSMSMSRRAGVPVPPTTWTAGLKRGTAEHAGSGLTWPIWHAAWRPFL